MISSVAKIFYGGIAVGSVFGGSALYFLDSKESSKENLLKETPSKIEFDKWNPNWDRREAQSLLKPGKRSEESEKKKLKELASTAKRHIFMIRHGQYETEASCDEKMVLTPLGREQAEILGQRLKNLKINFSTINRSRLTRAIETSDIIHKFLPNVSLETSELLNEGRPVPCEPKSGSWWPEQKYFQEGPRIEAAFRKYFYRAPADQKSDSYELIVCHANVIRYFVCRLLQVPPDAWLRFSLHHCSITQATIYPDGEVVVQCYGDSGFLPANKMTR